MKLKYRSLLLLSFLSSFCVSCSLFSGLSRTQNADSSAKFYPKLEQCGDILLQANLEKAISRLGLVQAAEEHRLSLAVVDITNIDNPRFAGINANQMMYAASLPKIAILLGLFKRVEEGSLTLDSHIRTLAHEMIRYSSNQAATELYRLVTPEYIAKVLTSPRYRLYEKQTGGGIWVGKEYSKAPAWKREPLMSLSHAATAMQVARFYYLLETSRLVSPQLTVEMKEALAHPGIRHKFVQGLLSRYPDAVIYRKSGSWSSFHSDSAIVVHKGRRYIVASLINDQDGARWLEKIISELHKIIVPQTFAAAAINSGETSAYYGSELLAAGEAPQNFYAKHSS